MTAEDADRGTQANPDTYLPEWMEGTATKVDGWGLWILTVHGECSCGNWARRLAPDWKIPAEWGGGYMTDDCMSCFGTMEYEDRWERVDKVVDEYSSLKPPEAKA